MNMLVSLANVDNQIFCSDAQDTYQQLFDQEISKEIANLVV